MQAIMLDTDIGTDVDDILAIGLAMRSPELEMRAITLVYGDVDLRARMVERTLAIGGRSGIPMGRGISLPLLRQRAVYWTGHEGEGLLDGTETTPSLPHAVDLIIQTIRSNPGQITLVPIGPLTNVAVALTVAPDIVPLVKEVVVMGGVAGRGDGRLPVAEHNIVCDPEAAALVFGAGWPIYMVGLDVTTQVRLRRDQLERLATSGRPLPMMLADQARRYMDFRQNDYTHLHDPLTILALTHRDLLGSRPMNVQVELQGAQTAGATVVRQPSEQRPANAEVCLEVDAERAVAIWLERVNA